MGCIYIHPLKALCRRGRRKMLKSGCGEWLQGNSAFHMQQGWRACELRDCDSLRETCTRSKIVAQRRSSHKVWPPNQEAVCNWHAEGMCVGGGRSGSFNGVYSSWVHQPYSNTALMGSGIVDQQTMASMFYFSSFRFFFCFVLFFPGRVSLYSHDCLGTCSIEQARLEFTEIQLPLPPECWD